MGARRYGPDISHYLQPDNYAGALDDLSLSSDPLTDNRYTLAGANPINFVEIDGHTVEPGGGGSPQPQWTSGLTRRQQLLVRKLRSVSVDGIKIVNPRLVVIAAAKAHIVITLAVALLSQESGGGRSEWGHDQTIFIGGYDAAHRKHWGSIVTKAAYLAYKAERGPTGQGGMQGVGPMQLTWYGYQDLADKLGGAWRPLPNMIVGFRVVLANIRASGLRAGVAAYNGSGAAAAAYAQNVLAYERKWARILGLKSIQG